MNLLRDLFSAVRNKFKPTPKQTIAPVVQKEIVKPDVVEKIKRFFQRNKKYSRVSKQKSGHPFRSKHFGTFIPCKPFNLGRGRFAK